ncbi:MAG: ribosome small subunit-dependent GTPase A [Cyclobacteriaceae bacterium]
MNTLESIGLNDHIRNHLLRRNLSSQQIGRVLRHYKTQYLVRSDEKEAPAELTGNLLHAGDEHPVVGDWVQVVDFDGKYIITHLLPRYSQLARKSIHSGGRAQLIGANIDQAFIIQSLDHDFNLNRLERYITMAFDGGVQPIVILNKADLVSEDELNELVTSVKKRINEDIQILAISALQEQGLMDLNGLLRPGTTSCFVGSSGVGKSTILNRFLDADHQMTADISSSTSKGRHTTTSRQLFLVQGGGIVMDTPGMRELGVASSAKGLKTGFANISELSEQCRFTDCTHQDEPGCAVQKAVSDGHIDVDQLDNYLKLIHESQRFQKTKAEMNREGKRFGKILKEAQAHRKTRKP